jgi:SulP family sulfate permease
VLATCFLVTVFVDMVASVTAGFILAAILFMKRMSDLTQSRFTLDASHEGRLKAPPNVVIYEINGPLFFGAAQKAMATLGALSSRSFDVLVLHLGRVPVIDATGLVALETAIEGLFRDKKHVILAGPLPHPEAIFDKAKLEAKFPALIVTDALPTAVMLSADLASEPLPTSGRSSVSRMRV